MTLKSLLLEVGFEEMPAAYLPPAVEQLRVAAPKMFEDLRLPLSASSGGPVCHVYATPRRLALVCDGVPDLQEERTIEVKGPSRSVAFDSEGGFTRAAQGFARSQGVRPEDLKVVQTSGGEYVFAVKRDKGRPAEDVLSEAIPSLISSLQFPRTMRWGAGDQAFARPVRWIVALLDGAVLDFEFAGVRSGRQTYGHRILGAGPFDIADARDYLHVLEKAGVVADQESRRRMIVEQVEAVARSEGGEASMDPDLVEQVNYLVEYPTAFAGRFSEEYLDIPEEVLVTTMKHHQRYFPVYARTDDSGNGRSLLPVFIAVRNGGDEGLDQVRQGNERVIRARLADASFFFNEDQKTRLEDRVDLLKGILFQENLGTLYDKTCRLRSLAARIAESAGMPAGKTSLVDRAALLCKTDLTTNMVKEFTELQGTMGREYAKRQGEDSAVCAAIDEHYKPRAAKGDLPETVTGSILALADKIDTLCGYFFAGITPTGSQDPFGLRRQGAGVIAILAAAADRDSGESIRVSLGSAVETALEPFTRVIPGRAGEAPKVKAEVLDFLRGRLKVYLEDEGLRHDVIDAVLEAGFDDVAEAVNRARALQGFSAEGEFAEMMVGFKRAANLAKQAESSEVDESLFAEPEEHALYKAFVATKETAGRLLSEGDYGAFFKCMAGLKGPVDGFLDRVLVMSEDPGIRRNRLALLSSVAGLFGRAADLSKLVVG